MRSTARNIVTSIGLGTLAMSYVIGMNSATASGSFSASGGLSGGPTGASTPAPSASSSSEDTQSQGDSSGTATTTAPAPATSSKPTTTKKPSAAPKPSSSSSSSASSSSNSGSSTSVSKTGSLINYNEGPAYGVVKLTVTKVNGKITAISLDQATATGGRQSVFQPLVNAAIAAQGSNFGNATGATVTVNAFKQALDSALSKF